MQESLKAAGAHEGGELTDQATQMWRRLRAIQRSAQPQRYWDVMQAIKRDPDLYVAWVFDSHALLEHFVVHFQDGSRLIVRNDLTRRESR